MTRAVFVDYVLSLVIVALLMFALVFATSSMSFDRETFVPGVLATPVLEEE